MTFTVACARSSWSQNTPAGGVASSAAVHHLTVLFSRASNPVAVAVLVVVALRTCGPHVKVQISPGSRVVSLLPTLSAPRAGDVHESSLTETLVSGSFPSFSSVYE